MLRGANKQREQEYEELVSEFKTEHRYEGREEEVAARIVNKQRAEYGETQAAKQEDCEGHSPDRDLPIKNYDMLTVEEIVRRVEKLSDADRDHIFEYERQNKNRKTLLETLTRL